MKAIIRHGRYVDFYVRDRTSGRKIRRILERKGTDTSGSWYWNGLCLNTSSVFIAKIRAKQVIAIVGAWQKGDF